MAITERFELIEVRVKRSVAEDGSNVPGGYTKYGMLHLVRDDGTDAAPPQATELTVDGTDPDVIALAGGGGAAALQAQVQANNAMFEQLRADKAAADAARDAATAAASVAKAKLSQVTQIVSAQG